MVQVYELEIEVTADGKVRVESDSALPPGRHHTTVTIESNGDTVADSVDQGANVWGPPGWRGIPTLNMSWPWGPEMTFSRKQIYDDEF